MAKTFYSLGGIEPEERRGFLVRDLVRFLAVDIIIIIGVKLMLLLGFLPTPDSYVLTILASKLVLFSYLVWLIRERRDAWRETGGATLGKWWAWPCALVLYAAALPVSIWLGGVNHQLMAWLYARIGWVYSPEAQDIILIVFGGVLSKPVLGVMVFFTVLAGPFMEELAFRGMGLDGFRRDGGAGMALFWTSLLFGLYHFSLAQLLPLSFLGAVFGAARLLSGSLWCGVAVHCLHNAVVLGINAHELGLFELPKIL